MALYSHICLRAIVLGAVIVAAIWQVEGKRARARTNDSRLTFKKPGHCPEAEVVNRLTNTVCDNIECEIDADCTGTRKCCRNNCGGQSCTFPLDEESDVGVTETPAVSELEGMSGTLTVNEGETAVLYCNATSLIPTSYGWILVQPGPQMPVIDVFPPGSTIGNKRVSSDGRQMSVIGARVEDTANYACVAASLLGYVTKSYQLYVHASGMRPPAAPISYEIPEESRPEVSPSPTGQPDGDAVVDMRNWPQLVSPYLPGLSQRISTTVAPPRAVTSPPPNNEEAPLHVVMDSTTICSQARDKGTCDREETRWFFNTSKGKCEQFVYSGCNGNLNNFRSYDECNRTCPYVSENPCEQPIFTGPCRARFTRWGYDSARGDCVQFVYGGCRQNGNNFSSREKCSAKCIQPQYLNFQARDAHLPECHCVKQRLKNCFCSSEFAIEGTIIQKHNSQRGDILVVEVENVFKQGTLSLRKASAMTNNVTIIRDMSQVGQSCQCHRLEPGCFRLGDFFAAVKNDFPQAAVAYQQSCEAFDHPRGCSKIGAFYLYGKGVDKDREKALRYFTKGCDLGSMDSCFGAGSMLLSSKTAASTESDTDQQPMREKGLAILDAACKKGDHQASCFNLGALFIQGSNGVAKDMKRAVDYSARSCDLGHMYGCMNASRMYALGDGIQKDEALAIKYKDRAKALHEEAAEMKKQRQLQFSQTS